MYGTIKKHRIMEHFADPPYCFELEREFTDRPLLVARYRRNLDGLARFLQAADAVTIIPGPQSRPRDNMGSRHDAIEAPQQEDPRPCQVRWRQTDARQGRVRTRGLQRGARADRRRQAARRPRRKASDARGCQAACDEHAGRGAALCWWRLGHARETAAAFRKMLWLNPSDNQGARLDLPAVDAGQTWEQMDAAKLKRADDRRSRKW
jgi:hypothetical protein